MEKPGRKTTCFLVGLKSPDAPEERKELDLKAAARGASADAAERALPF